MSLLDNFLFKEYNKAVNVMETVDIHYWPCTYFYYQGRKRLIEDILKINAKELNELNKEDAV